MLKLLYGAQAGTTAKKITRLSARLAANCRWIAAVFAVSILATGSMAAPARAASAPNGRVAFLGTDDQIYWCSGDCSKPECITCPKQGFSVRREPRFVPSIPINAVRQVGLIQAPGMPPMPPSGPERPMPSSMKYAWPTFSPDGSKIAFAWAGPNPDGNFFGLTVYEFARHISIPIFESNNEKVIYIQWTPDGSHISFLLNEPQGLSLILAQVKEKAPVRMLLNGAPIYFDWNHAGDKLVAHFNSSDDARTEKVAIMDVSPTDQEITRTLARGRSPFKAPCWSPDGKHLAYITNVRAETYIDVTEPDGSKPRALASLPVGDSSMVWSPDSRHIAYSTAVIGEELVLHGIQQADVVSGESKWLTKDNVLAFFYSPDANYLAYIGVPANKPFYTWHVLDLKNGKNRELESFLSTQEEALFYRYFDQLAISQAIWSPDSKQFVFAGVRVAGDASHPPRSSPAPSLWVVPIDGGKPQSYPGAVLAIYSPPAK